MARQCHRPRGFFQKDDSSRYVRATIQFTVMIIIGLVLYFKFDHIVMGRIVFGLAVIVLVSGLCIPPVFHAIERFGRALGHGAATGLTWLLLVPFFYIVFVPARFFLKLRGKDPLCRAFPTQEATYWVPRPPVENLDHYRKQH